MALVAVNIGGKKINVSQDLANRLNYANSDFKAATGKELAIVEGHRTEERQAELYQNYISGKSGRAAPPGKSFHQTGLAVDVSNWQEAQSYLNRYGLRNDMEDDKNHFSLGETKPVKYANLAEKVDKARREGKTDTYILDAIMKQKPTFRQSIETARSRYNVDEELTNDRELLNFLSKKFSGKLPSVPSVPLPEEEKSPTFGQQISSQIGGRVSAIQRAFQEERTGKITPPELTIRGLGGIIGGIGDILGTTAMEAIKAVLPQSVEEGIKKSFEGSLAGSEIPKLFSQYQGWKEKNPRLAANLEAVGNIASVLPIGAGGKIATKQAGIQAGKIAGQLEKGVQKTLFQEALDVIKPVLTKAEKEVAVARGQLRTQGFLRSTSLAPSATDEAIARSVTGIVKKKASPTQNIQAVREAIGELGKNVETELQKFNAIFNERQLRSFLSKAKEESRITFASDKTLERAYDSVTDELFRQLQKQSKNSLGLWKARQAFDDVVEAKFPKVFTSEVGDNVRRNAIRDIRRAVNEYIAARAPKSARFQESLKLMNKMYSAIDNIASKNIKFIDSNIITRGLKAVRQNPVSTILIAGGLTGAGIAGILNSPLIVGALLLGGTYKLGKAVITSTSIRSFLSKILRALEKQIQDAPLMRKPILQEQKKDVENLVKVFSEKNVPKAEGAATPKTAGVVSKISATSKELESLLQEARKYKSAEEFVKAQGDNYVKSTKEYKDWAKGSKNIIEAYHGTPYSFDKFEIGKKQAGVYKLDGISFATDIKNAEPFSRQYPDWYYSKLQELRSKYPNISEIESKAKILENGKRVRSVESIKKEGQQWIDDLNKEWKKDGDWFYGGNYEKFKQRRAGTFKIIEDLKSELTRSQNYVKPTISPQEAKTLALYNKELQTLEDSVQGNVYKVHIKGKKIIDEVGEDIGFGSTRNSMVAELDGDILRIKDADTGQYIGEEIIVNDPSQVFILNSPKTKSQLTDIWKKAKNKKF